MSEILKYSNSKKPLKWYEQDQEENDQKTIALNKKNLSTEWNQNRPVITKLYRTTLEDQANTQLFLIDSILKRLDDIEFQNTDTYKYNGYLYNSPSHKKVICWKDGNVKQNGFSFTVHKPIENKSQNGKQIDLVRISPVSKVDKSKEMDYVNQFLASLTDSKSVQNNKDYKQSSQVNPSTESLINGLNKKKSIKNMPEVSKIINEVQEQSKHFTPIQNRETISDNKNSTREISSDDLIDYLKSKNLSTKTENSKPIEKRKSPKDEQKRNNHNKEPSSHLSAIAEVISNTEVKSNASKESFPVNLPPRAPPSPLPKSVSPSRMQTPLPPRATPSPLAKSPSPVPSPKRTPLPTLIRSTPPAPPPPPPLLVSDKNNKKVIELVTSSGEENGSQQLPENFLNEILETKKSLKHQEETKPVVKKVEREIGFVQELKEYLNKIKESSKNTPRNDTSNQQIENVDLDKKDENTIKNQQKNVKTNQETQTELSRSKSINSSILSKKSSKSKLSSSSVKSNRSSNTTPHILLPSSTSYTSSNNSLTPKEKKYENEFRNKTINSVPFHTHSSTGSSKNSYKTASSDTSFLDDDKFRFGKLESSLISEDDKKKSPVKSKYVDKNTSPISNIRSSNSSLFSNFLQQKILISDDERKKFKEDFKINIFNEKFPQLEERGAPLVYECHSRETDSRLKNGLIKFFFDLEKYHSLSNTNEFDLLVHPAGSSRPESVDNSFSLQKAESESYIGNLNDSKSNDTIASRELFFENLRQMIEESQDETDTDYQKSFQNLNEFYNNLLKKYQERYRKTENVEIVSSALSEEGEQDSYDNFIQSSQNQFSDGSIIQSELSDVYKSEQKKILKVPNSGLIVVDEISEENSSDTIFRPGGKKKIENESYEKMNISSGIDDRPINKIPKSTRSRSRTETLSQENMNISSDSDDTILKPVLRKTSTRYKSKLNSSDMNKVYIEEEKKLSTVTLNKSPKADTKSIWFEVNENKNSRPQSVPVQEVKKEEKDRPKSVVFSDDIFGTKSSNEIENKQKKELEEDKKSLAELWSEINKVEKEKREKHREEMLKNQNLLNIWKEARDVTQKRSQMQVYERITIEQRASELEKILEIDNDKKEDSESDDYINPKFNLKPISKVEEVVPSVEKSQSDNQELSKFQKLIQKFENPNQDLKKQDSSISTFSNMSASDRVKKLDSSNTTTTDSPKEARIYSDLSVSDRFKKLETSTSTTTSDSPKETRISGLLISKDIKIDSGKNIQRQNSITDPSKPFSLQASSFLNKLKGDKKPDDMKSSLNVESGPSDSEVKNLFSTNDKNKLIKDASSKESEIRKSFALSEHLPQVDEVSRSSLNILDDSSKRSSSNKKEESDLSQSSEKLSNSDAKSNSDIDKYFRVGETPSPEVPIKMEKRRKFRSSKKSEMSRDSLNLSEDYQLRKSGSVFTSIKISDDENQDEKEDEKEGKETAKTDKDSEERDSFILDKILLKTSAVDPDEERYFKDRSNLNPDEISIVSKIESDEADQNTNKKLKNRESFQDSYKSDIENEVVSIGPAPETVELIRRLKQPSQSANVGIFGLERVNGDKQRQGKLSGGKQRKPNEETVSGENEYEYRRTKSSLSMNTNRYKIFNRLFNRDKSDSESDGLKKKSNVKK